ncbi:MAG: hypothetical protein FJ272_01650 [Planctomycetes bacterium]|nr:hypothetical protein [Planctomycetota bacterium]MBM4083470.1 hypothetical protein [Planctomycetota bacterium]
MNPKPAAWLEITNRRVYNTYLVDGKWAGSHLAKFSATDVTVRGGETCSRMVSRDAKDKNGPGT